MIRLLTILALLLASPALAQTPITQDMANNYFDNCMLQDAPLMTGESQELLCSCTAVKMMENMTVEDAQAMSPSNPDARVAFNHMMLEVYAPCISYPTYDYHYRTCIENPDTKKLTRKYKQLCECMAGEVADYLEINAQDVFRGLIQRNPNIYDPMAALLEDKQFNEFAQEKLLTCYVDYR